VGDYRHACLDPRTSAHLDASHRARSYDDGYLYLPVLVSNAPAESRAPASCSEAAGARQLSVHCRNSACLASGPCRGLAAYYSSGVYLTKRNAGVDGAGASYLLRCGRCSIDCGFGSADCGSVAADRTSCYDLSVYCYCFGDVGACCSIESCRRRSASE